MGYDLAGALQGIGAGLMHIGSARADDKKQTLLAKLEADREKRQDEREAARYKRAQAEYDPSQDKLVEDENGGVFKVQHTKGGAELKRVPATSFELEDIKNSRDDRKLKLEDRLLNRASTQSDIAYKNKLAGNVGYERLWIVGPMPLHLERL